MDPHAQHRLEVSLRRMAIDTSAKSYARAMELARLRLEEREQQLQIEVSGTATPTPGSTSLDLAFDLSFSTANGRRDSHLPRPHVSFGFEQTSIADESGNPTDVAVILAASVVRWTFNGNEVVGAKVAISALAPVNVSFTGIVHATFQGLGAVPDEPDMEG